MRHAKGHEVLLRDLGELALVARHRDVGVRLGVAMPREVLADRPHAGLREALHNARAERADRGGVEVQRAVTDDRAAAIVEVEHGREAEVDAVRGELRSDDIGDGPRRVARCAAVAIPQAPELAHRRNGREALAEALHPATLVVDADRQRGLAQPLHILAELG